MLRILGRSHDVTKAKKTMPTMKNVIKPRLKLLVKTNPKTRTSKVIRREMTYRAFLIYAHSEHTA